MVVTRQKGNPETGFDWVGLGWQYLFFWYFSGVVQVLIQLSGITGFSGFRSAMLMSTLWLIPTLLFPRKTRIISAVLGFVFWVCSLVSLGYFFIYRQEFSQSVLFILFESNAAESSEYISHYFSWSIITGFLLYSVGAFLLWRQVRPVYLSHNRTFVLSGLILFSLFVYPLKQMVTKDQSFEKALTKLQTRMEPAVPWQIVMGYYGYRTQLANMQQLLEANAKTPSLRNLKDAHAGKPSTLVLVIGESTNRKRMSLYGYARATTPELDSMRNELSIFTNVISPRPYTIEALQQALTFADQKNPDLYLTKPSLMNMMKQAGYKTYWITNQQTLTKRNTMLTTFSQQTDKQYYLNNTRNQNTRQYDDVVLTPFEKVLKRPDQRKFIVVHLLGTHMNYKYRYPQEYARFNDRKGVPAWVDEGNELSFYNSYDNAILYHDFVVASLIKAFSSSQQNGLLVYFSDHGEEVFDTPILHFKGRNEASPLPAMYTIPFIVWTSKIWGGTHAIDYQAALNHPYSIADFIYTWADLAGIHFDDFDPTKSLVNKDFKESTRYIGNPYAENGLVDFNLVLQNEMEQKTLMEAKQK